MKTEAWVLAHGRCAGEAGEDGIAGFDRREIELGEPGPDEVLVEPLFAAWEGNLDHAVRRHPIDVCEQRGEDEVILGNSGVVRVLSDGAGNPGLSEGQLAILLPRGEVDQYGYTKLVHGYDKPGSRGILSKRAVLPRDVLFPLEPQLQLTPQEITAAGRYIIAWNNWKVALACWRSQMPSEDPRDHLVFGWGGGVALGGLLLARDAGFRVAMATASDRRIQQLQDLGIVPVDRCDFPGLTASASDLNSRELRKQRPESEARFAERVREISPRGEGAAIILDHIGGNLYIPTLNSLARQGVISTVGWKAGMRMTHLRASEAIARHIHVNTHMTHWDDVQPALDYAVSNEWVPEVDDADVYDWGNVRSLAYDYHHGATRSYFPMVSIQS